MKAKRVLGLVLSAAMVATGIPATALAAEATTPAEPVADQVEESQMLDGSVTSDGTITYKVYLPDGYSEDQSYPSVYLMPYDGYKADTYVEDGITDALDDIMSSGSSMEMVVVMPNFTEAQDYDEILPAVIEDVESKYAVIPDAGYRAILGVNVGAYMAYENVLINASGLFSCAGAHMGDFTTEANPYLGKGAIASAVSKLSGAWYNNLYLYIDAPNGDPKVTATNSTTTIGNNLVSKTGKINERGEYAVIPGEFGVEYYQTAMERSFNRFSTRFAGSIVSTDLGCEPSVVTNDDETATGTVKFTVSDSIGLFAESVPDIEVRMEMVDPATGEVLTSETQTIEDAAIGEETVVDFTLDHADMAAGTNTTLNAYITVLGLTKSAGTMSVVNVLPTGTADDEQLIDLMGNWYFKAYKAYRAATVDLDKIENIVPETYETWGLVHPALGWWTSDFDSSLGGNSNYGGYAWYVRTFEVPEDFAKENLLCPVGMFDEANEVYINGHLIGSTGMNFGADGVGVYDGSNPWDVNCVYNLDSSYVNYGGENTIAIRMCNSSGGGGWYQGPVGIYSMAAYNKAAGKPSVYAPADVQATVKATVAAQAAALADEDIAAYDATIAPDYFESGYTKERQMNEVAGWLEGYDNIVVEDENVGVFVYNDLYVYQAVRTISGEVDGVVKTIASLPEYLEYFKVAGDEACMYGSHSRFFVDKTKAVVQTAKPYSTYRIYLPEGYFDEGNTQRYQTLYLFHGINSQSATFAIDKVDQYLDEAIAEGLIDPVIAVIPDDPTSNKMSWWRNAYEAMITQEILPDVDSRYRTIADARFRMTGGCSMGGGGSFNVGLFNADLFSGAISFYGAINYAGANSIIPTCTPEYLKQYAIYMTCGNQDTYSFYNVQEQMSGVFTQKGVEHYHEVDNGGHDSIFYLPRFIPSLVYMKEHMNQPAGAGEILSGDAEVEVADDVNVTYTLNVSEEVADYLNTVIVGKITTTKNTAGAVTSISKAFGEANETTKTLDLNIPVQIDVIQNGVVVATKTDFLAVNEAGEIVNTVPVNSTDLDTEATFTVVVTATALNESVELANIEVAPAAPAVDHWVLSANGKWWYSHADGSYAANGWEKINGKWYYFDAAGWMLTGWVKDAGKWYYLKDSGAMATGWVKVDGKWYYMAASGAMTTGWQYVDGKWYYMDASGAMVTGWLQLNGKWYFMDGSGAMVANTTLNGYTFDANGVWIA